MKLGLITDVHECVDKLARALATLRNEQVDQIVFIGDAILTGEQLEETCDLLLEHDAAGVWGNHDYLHCQEARSTTAETNTKTTRFLTSLQARYEVAGCLFQHVEPWLDANELCDLWHFEGPPVTEEQRHRIFAATSHQVIFAGHYHRWLLASNEGRESWSGDKPVQMDFRLRYFVVVGALCEGRFATFDTVSRELVPFNIATN